MVLAGEDLVAHRRDEPELLIREASALMVRRRCRLLERCIGGDHFAGHQILADAEMLQRPLGLRAPELVRGNLDLAETVGFDTYVAHKRPSSRQKTAAVFGEDTPHGCNRVVTGEAS